MLRGRKKETKSVNGGRIVSQKTGIKRKNPELTKARSSKNHQLTEKERKEILRKVLSKKTREKPGPEKTEKPENEITNRKVEQNKRLIMWSGVAFLMILIVSLWIYNIKQVFRQPDVEGRENFSLDSWQEITNEIGEKMNQMKEGLGDIKSLNEINEQNLPETSDSGLVNQKENPLFSTSSSPQISPQEIDELKKKLEALEDRLNGERQ